MTRLVILVLGISFAILAGCNHQPDSDARKRELASAILKETGAIQLATDNAHSNIMYWKKSRPDVPDDFWEREVKDVESVYASQMIESYIRAYTDELTEEELRELYEYLQTPIGRKFK